MKNALVIGMNKTGTTILASVIQRSIPGSLLYVEPVRVAFFEKRTGADVPLVVKLLYEHWMHRPSLLTGIVRGETGFNIDKTVALVRDPRDALISALMYAAHERVQEGARREQVDEWVQILREKEANPEKHSVASLIDHFGRIFDTRYGPDWMFESFVGYSAWIAANRERCFVLRYEDFIAGNTHGMAAYLGVQLSPSRDVDSGLRRVARTRSSGDWRKMMLPEDMSRWSQRYGSSLAAYGYDDWETRPERCDPAEGSDYVRKITREAFDRMRRPG